MSDTDIVERLRAAAEESYTNTNLMEEAASTIERLRSGRAAAPCDAGEGKRCFPRDLNCRYPDCKSGTPAVDTNQIVMDWMRARSDWDTDVGEACRVILDKFTRSLAGTP